MYPYMKALALRRLALCSLKRRAEAKESGDVRGNPRQSERGADLCGVP